MQNGTKEVACNQVNTYWYTEHALTSTGIPRYLPSAHATLSNNETIAAVCNDQYACTQIIL